MRRAPFNPLPLIAVIVMAAAVAEFSVLHYLLPLENRLSDFFVRTHAANSRPDPDIVIVDIDEASLAKMNVIAGSWPWPRSVHGELIEGLGKQRPAAIVFDILFSEPDLYRPESDAFFNGIVKKYRNTYFPIVRQNPADDIHGVPLSRYANALGIKATPHAATDAKVSLQLPYAVAPENWRGGTINFVEDEDGIGRRYYVYIPAYGWRIPSLPARVAQDLGYPVPRQETMILGWRGGTLAHSRVSYAELYEDFSRKHPQRPSNEFAGKIVIVGTTATGLHDLRATPVGSLTPAVEILATALDNLKNGGTMRAAQASIPPLLALLLVGGLLGAFLARRNTLQIGAVLLPVSAGLLATSYYAAGRLYLLPLLAPLGFAWAFYFVAALHEYLRERRARDRAVQMFGRFLDPRVVKELVAEGQTIENMGGRLRNITVLFSDIRGFTALSENRGPAEIVALLNRYFSMQVEVIFHHGGTLDKFIGDAIMAFWGAPADDDRHAGHAITAALEMEERLQQFRRELGEAGKNFDIGIGIHSGPAVVGFIGSERRQEYTAIGDTVNLASRIEGQTRDVARILVSADTMQQCKNSFDFIEHGSYKVKGRAQEVRLFEPRRKPW